MLQHMKIWNYILCLIVLACGYGVELAGKTCEPCQVMVNEKNCDKLSCPDHVQFELKNDLHETAIDEHHAECGKCSIDVSDTQPVSLMPGPLKVIPPEPAAPEPVILSYYCPRARIGLAGDSPRIHLFNLALRSVVLLS